MTGYRVGFLVAPPTVLSRALVVQGQATTGATTFAMDGAVAALEGDHGFLDGWREAYDRRRRLIVGLLDGIDGVACEAPAGAFYVFPDVRALIGRSLGGAVVDSDVRLAELLLDEARVAAVPGSAFGAPGFLRLSYACDERTITAGIGRVADLVSRLDV
jgi:aspartate/methionine/tyrosine aminotransferase